MKAQTFAVAAAIAVALGFTGQACAQPSLSYSNGTTNANNSASFSLVVNNPPPMTLLDMNNPIVSVAVNGNNIPQYLFTRGKDNLSGSLKLSANVAAGNQTVQVTVLLDNGAKVTTQATLNFVMAKPGGCEADEDSDPPE